VNNERVEKWGEYKARLAAVEKFVMVVFEGDKTVVPKESGWFAEVNETSGAVTNLRQRAIYKEDWIGLRALDEKEGLVFESVEGEHMELDQQELEMTFGKYFGAERKLGGKPTNDALGGSGQQQVMALGKDW
jgi:palmitoyl-protein thioesterase